MPFTETNETKTAGTTGSIIAGTTGSIIAGTTGIISATGSMCPTGPTGPTGSAMCQEMFDYSSETGCTGFESATGCSGMCQEMFDT